VLKHMVMKFCPALPTRRWRTCASPGGWGPTNIARDVIRRILNPIFLSELASYDVASSMCHPLPRARRVLRARPLLEPTDQT